MPSFKSFEARALADGYDEALARTWPADAVADRHTHPFAARLLVVRGEMWLTVGEETRHFGPGDSFELDADLPHAERYGEEGATYWVARRKRKGPT